MLIAQPGAKSWDSVTRFDWFDPYSRIYKEFDCCYSTSNTVLIFSTLTLLLKSVRFEIDKQKKLNILFAKLRKLQKDTCSKLGETKFSEFITI
jgi:hypothetical protein